MDRVAAGEQVIITRHGQPRLRLSPAVPVLSSVAARLGGCSEDWRSGRPMRHQNAKD
jgi:antitoxin (DNA-binding transcriptional repressor) of toxin-antitoxin stability system